MAVSEEHGWPGGALTESSSEIESLLGVHLRYFNFVLVVLDNLNYWATIKDLQKALPHVSVLQRNAC